MAEQPKSLSLKKPTNTAALRAKAFRLIGTPMNDNETKEGEFEKDRKIIEKNKELFKYRGSSKNKITRIVDAQNTPKLEFPTNVRNAIDSLGGVDLVFAMGKKLEETDVNKFQNRLYIPKSRRLMDYLTEDEKKRIEIQGRDGGLDVIGIDPRGETYNLNLKLWQSSGSSNKYVLIKEWAKLVRDNCFVKDDSVEVWCFRVESNLRVAVIAEMRVDTELKMGSGTGGESRTDRGFGIGISGERRANADVEIGISGERGTNDMDLRIGIGTSGVWIADMHLVAELKREFGTSDERRTDEHLEIGTSGETRTDIDFGIGTSGETTTIADLSVENCTSDEWMHFGKAISLGIGTRGETKADRHLEIGTNSERRANTNLLSGDSATDMNFSLGIGTSDDWRVDRHLKMGTSGKRRTDTNGEMGTNTDHWIRASIKRRADTDVEIDASCKRRADTDLTTGRSGKKRGDTELGTGTSGERRADTGRRIGINHESDTNGSDVRRDDNVDLSSI